MNTSTRPVPPTKPAHSTQEEARRLARAGCWTIALSIFPIGLWMSMAPLSMAVVAPAFVKVDLNRRPVQHLEGGTVRAVLVRDGHHVKAGDPILILGDVRIDADRNRLFYRVLVERAALARLEAEHAVARSLEFPAEVVKAAQTDERIRHALQKETGLFQAQRHSLESATALMRTQRDRVEQEIISVNAQIDQAKNSLALQRQDLETNRGLIAEGFISTSRISQIDATVMEYAAKVEERRTELARAAQRLVEIDMKIQSIRNDYVKAASDQLKATTQRLSEIEQELRKSEDAALRQVVAAPASGEVIDLKFTSPGAVVGPGEAIADIVPSNTQLLIEAHIRPEDISNVRLNQHARIKFTAFKYRNTSMVTGQVSYVSGDRLIERQTNLPYYSVMILADAESLRSIGDFKLQAGMPAEVYIEGVTQTALQYIAEPITTTIRRSARQM
ncbi:HlyD family type I secretion periplasmic adaptor subunit [Hydrogenophaga sp. 2FB]|uniref:HlyD family type I secretion periplasmic adaptor subunit n=1 Tax=Hydrogenophaga sp. 2FB TaxID=2502187 RepID=UPI0010F68481|nr:HlyD family type I secretion periplasmic adaptor subunit [Hydrogenophaga sp. 2FB]